jgi:NADP-dependent 3-hydroxy acid dehydrogenase YdfG
MAKTILVVGFGPGISSGVAEKFGKEGFSVALVARSEERLAEGVKSLEAKGVKAAGFTANAADPSSLRAAIAQARDALGPIAVIHWNAYGAEAGDILSASTDEVRAAFDVAVVGLVATVQAALPDLKSSKDGAVLVTNGAFGDISLEVDKLAVDFKSAGLALSNAAKHKLVGLLAKALEADGVYVGEVVVAGTIKGTAWDRGNATLTGAAVADEFWRLYRARGEIRARVS